MWSEELARCKLAGGIALEYAAYAAGAPPPTGWKRFYEQELMRKLEASPAHGYRTAIPGTPWQLEAAVMTNANCVITEIIYQTLIPIALPAGRLKFSKSLGLLLEKFTVTGDSSGLGDRKRLEKHCKAVLRFRYEPPLFGFHLGGNTTKQMELPEASITLTPAESACEVVVRTTVEVEPAFVGKRYGLGLAPVLELLKALAPSG